MINTAHLSVEDAPPIGVPFRFFLTMPLFGMLFSLILLWFGLEETAGRWSPQVIGSLHLLNIGVLMMAVTGVLFQMLPVIGGIQLPYLGLVARLLHVSLTAGALLLCLGMVVSQAWLLMLSLLVLGGGIVPYLLLLLFKLFSTAQPPAWVVLLRYVSLFLLALTSLGMLLLLGWGEQLVLQRQWTDVHAVWALGGWFTLLLMATSFQLIPMFQVTPEFPIWLRRWLVPTLSIVLLIWGAGTISGIYSGRWGLLLALLGMACYGVIALNLLRQRKRKTFDAAVRFWQIALASLVAGALLLIAQLLQGAALPTWVGLLWIFAVLIPMLAGMLLKIAPFLVFLHLQQQMIRNPERISELGTLPNLFEILPAQWGRVLLWLYLLATVTVVLDGALHLAWHTTGGGLLLFFTMLQWIVYRCYHVYNTRAI